MPPEDDFRRDRDPRQRRNAALAGGAVAVCLLALGGVLLARGQANGQQPAGTTPLAVASVPARLPALRNPPLPPRPTAVPPQPVLGSGFRSVYDPASRQLVVFGGIDSYDATWVWDGQHWTLARPPVSPPGRFAAAMAYDPATRVVMLYGGRLGPGQLVSDTWAWDGRVWRQLDGGTGDPPAGEGFTMAWDQAHGQMVLAGGLGPGVSGTWTWNGSRWIRAPGGDLPAATFFVGMAADPVTHALLGASCCSTPQASTFTWSWNGSMWRELTTPTPPALSVGLVLDPQRSRLLLFADPSLTPGRETWSWSGRAWAPLAGAAPPVFPAGVAVDSDTGHVLIVGSVAQPVQGLPQPVQIWERSGTTWRQLG